MRTGLQQWFFRCAFLAALASQCYGQERGYPLLVPPREEVTWSIGAEGGWMQSVQSGSYTSMDMPFEDAKGSRGTASIFVELEANTYFSFGLNLGLDAKRISHSMRMADSGIIVFTKNDKVGIFPFISEINGSASATYFFINPYFKFSPFGNEFFIKASPEFGYLTSSNFTCIRTLVVPDSARFQDGSTSETLINGPIDGVKKLRIALLFSAGYDIPIIENFSLFPEVRYDLPLTMIAEDSKASDNWKIASFAALLGIKYKL